MGNVYKKKYSMSCGIPAFETTKINGHSQHRFCIWACSKIMKPKRDIGG